MRELKTDHQIIRFAVMGLVRSDQGFAEPGQASLIFFVDDELVRIRAPIGPHGHGFASVNQLRSAFAKTMPAPSELFRNAAGGCSVPTLHRVDGISVANSLAIDRDVFYQLRQ